ncbi:uncharacterized protein LOC114530050 [Dendronephthya gigantea]|uniref:uncharacterized protein LOC114530050 n=1 Tax=Dendronephthya gigantea TaxID=151771 RepID=UPI00106CDF8F|nr:uncharacterized protein LOC114530050 [Dendronephthya gigantea]
MSLSLEKTSSAEDVVLFLERNGFSDLVDEFVDNKIDGEDFFAFELRDIKQFIPTFKTRKKFIALWTSITGMEFDSNGAKVDRSTAFPGYSSESNATPEKETGSIFDSVHCDQPVEPATLIQASKEVTETSPCNKTTSNSSKSLLSPHSWIKNFKIPSRWEPNVENALKAGQLTPEQKSALNRQLCMSIMAQHSGQLTAAERNQVAIMLIQKYPCLSGSFGTGHQFWAKKIRDRLLNVGRRDAREHKRNVEASGKVYEKRKPGRKRKLLESSEIPLIPAGETEETVNEQHSQLKAFCKTNKQDVMLVRQLMDGTFPKRRKTILEDNERVWKTLKNYPPLTRGNGSEIKAELGRILKRERVAQEMKEAFSMIRLGCWLL